MLGRLHRIGIRTHGDLSGLSDESLAQELGISAQEAANLLQQVQSSQARRLVQQEEASSRRPD